MPKKRHENIRKPHKRVLIICEGGCTEPAYFNSFKKDTSLKLYAVNIEIPNTKYTSAKKLVKEASIMKKEAKAERNPFDFVWVVIDKNGYTKNAEAFSQAIANKISIAFSSICFEYWYLLHFKYTTKLYICADDLIHYLKTYISDYKKSDNYYSKLKHKMQDAITNAKKVQDNYKPDIERGTKIYELPAYTDVNKLVELLLSLGKQ